MKFVIKERFSTFNYWKWNKIENEENKNLFFRLPILNSLLGNYGLVARNEKTTIARIFARKKIWLFDIGEGLFEVDSYSMGLEKSSEIIKLKVNSNLFFVSKETNSKISSYKYFCSDKLIAQSEGSNASPFKNKCYELELIDNYFKIQTLALMLILLNYSIKPDTQNVAGD